MSEVAEDGEVPREVDGFTVVPIALPMQKSFPVPATHYLFVKLHQPKMAESTSNRSLFLASIPFDSTELNLKHLLSTQIGLPAGRIEEVCMEGRKPKAARADPSREKKGKRKKVSSYDDIENIPGAALPPLWDRELRFESRTAVVVFVDRASTEAALRALKAVFTAPKKPIWCDGMEGKEPALGYARYAEHERLTYPDEEELMRTADTYMAAYNEIEAEEARDRTRQRQEPDEDGFVQITRGGRAKPGKQEHAQVQAEKLKEKQKGLDDFYRFQSREKRKEKAGELLKKFDEDKARIQELRQRREKTNRP